MLPGRQSARPKRQTGEAGARSAFQSLVTPSRDLHNPQKLKGLTSVLAAAMLAGWCFIVADALRRDWQYIKAGPHVLGAVALYTFAAGILGLLAWLVTRFEERLSVRVSERHPVFGRWFGPLFYAIFAVLSSISTAFWTFSGEMISRTPVARLGPYAFLLLIGVAAAFTAYTTRQRLEPLRANKSLSILVAAILAAFGVVIIALDLTLFVALYAHLHTLLEVVAAFSLTLAFLVLFGAFVARIRGLGSLIRVLAVSALCWVGLVVLVRPLRTWQDHALRHVWLEEVYAGRVLRRVQTVEAFLANPWHWRGLAMSRVDRLRDRYDLSTTAQSSVWNEPPIEPLSFGDRIRELRGERRDFNVLVFYVDTLRQDVAQDPQIMPNVARFSKESLNFLRAYATGSDTLRSLPGLTGGSYDLHADHPNDLLSVARRSEHVSVLFIAQSAYEFLAKLRPTFKFEQTIQVPDYSPQKTDVWGYGADGPTSAAIVDKTLHFLKTHGQQRSLMWLFNFDQHNWRELDGNYVQDAAKKYGVPEEGEINWRYRVVARAIDAEFGRLLHGIEELGLSDRTIVLFVSDHGEALGRDGFWVHSVFLWESLVRVPLILRIPGVTAREIDQAVSLADVAPTLARYMEYEPPTSGYQGEDLLGYLVPERPKRRLPILMAAASKDTLVRVGVVEPSGRWKLVLSLEAALPELYDLRASDPDAVSVADAQPGHTLKMLEKLVRSPIFPRRPEDFEPTLP